MRDFKVIKVKKEEHSLQVEVEHLDDNSRRLFSFPRGEGYHNKENGDYKFMRHIAKQVERTEVAKNELSAISAIKNAVEGKIFEKVDGVLQVKGGI